MIGAMVPSGSTPRGSSRLGSTRVGRMLASLLALVLAAFAAGCDATGGDDEPRTLSGEEGESSEEVIGEGASELGAGQGPGSNAADPPGGGDETDDHADGQTGIGSPLDDCGGPDPIPWHRTLRDERANDA